MLGLRFCVLAASGLQMGSGHAAEPQGAMSLVLVGDEGAKSGPFAVLGGTVVVGRNTSGRGTGEAPPPDRMDVAFGADILADPSFVRWLAGSGERAAATLSVQGAKGLVVYGFSGIVLRDMTVTQSQDGAGQASLVVGASHATVSGIAIN